jgi:O-antigen ligase
MRPLGLGVFPGAAAWGGALAAAVGTALTLRRGPRIWRLACPAIAVAGMAIIYLGQVRTAIAMAILSLMAMPVLFLLQRDARRAVGLLICGAAIFAFGLVWVMGTGGAEAIRRFDESFHEMMEDPGDFYYRARGYHADGALEILSNYPLGCGMGRWGQAYDYFGDRSQRPSIDGRGQVYIEIQLNGWIIDGGIPLTVGYIAALLAGMWGALRVIRTTPDRDLGFWGVVIVAAAISIVAGTLSHPAFVLDRGLLFWLILAALHAADQQGRIERRKQAVRAMARAVPAGAAPR